MQLEIQRATDDVAPSDKKFSIWAEAALATSQNAADSLTIRVVSSDEVTALNRDYREKDKPTNVLSFPAEAVDIPGLPAEEQAELNAQLGDIAICASIVAAEAVEQGKSAESHWAHMTIHGVLHLLGHDHIDEAEAEAMELLETKLLADFGYSNPYIFDKE